MKNSLPFLLAADLLIPFLLAPTYKGYSHLTKVMSVLGNSKAPLHFVYNIWLVVFGIYFLFSAVRLYPVVAKTSSVIAVLLFLVIAVYAIGGCIVSGLFSVEETKSLETLSAKIHGFGSVIGFLLLALAPLLVGIYFFKRANGTLGAFSLLCFVLTIGFFTLFVMADKPKFQGTLIALEGLWQRLSLLSMYLPIMALCYWK
jgi:Protein of unknown function (DUF998).